MYRGVTSFTPISTSVFENLVILLKRFSVISKSPPRPPHSVSFITSPQFPVIFEGKVMQNDDDVIADFATSFRLLENTLFVF